MTSPAASTRSGSPAPVLSEETNKNVGITTYEDMTAYLGGAKSKKGLPSGQMPSGPLTREQRKNMDKLWEQRDSLIEAYNAASAKAKEEVKKIPGVIVDDDGSAFTLKLSKNSAWAIADGEGSFVLDEDAFDNESVSSDDSEDSTSPQIENKYKDVQKFQSKLEENLGNIMRLFDKVKVNQ